MISDVLMVRQSFGLQNKWSTLSASEQTKHSRSVPQCCQWRPSQPLLSHNSKASVMALHIRCQCWQTLCVALVLSNSAIKLALRPDLICTDFALTLSQIVSIFDIRISLSTLFLDYFWLISRFSLRYIFQISFQCQLIDNTLAIVMQFSAKLALMTEQNRTEQSDRLANKYLVNCFNVKKMLFS